MIRNLAQHALAMNSLECEKYAALESAEKEASAHKHTPQEKEEVQQVEKRLLNIINETKAELNNTIQETKGVLAENMAKKHEEVHDVIEGTRAILTQQIHSNKEELNGKIDGTLKLLEETTAALTNQ